MLEERFPVVGSDDDKSIVVEPAILQRVEETPDFTIQIGELSIVEIDHMADVFVTVRWVLMPDFFEQS